MAIRFIVEGARKDTGADATLVVEADDPAQAEKIAYNRGLYVSAVRPDPPAGPPTPTIAPPSSPPPLPQHKAGAAWACVIIGVIITAGVIALAGLLLSAKGPPTNLFSSEDRSFLDSLRKGWMPGVKISLQYEPNLNAIDPENGDTPFSLVLGQIDRLDPSSSTESRELQEWEELLARCVKAGADVNGSPNHSCPLALARSRRTVEYLLDHGAKVDGNGWGYTPLMWSADESLYWKAEILLERGANPNAQNYEGQTPLHKAAANNAMGMIGLLLEHGAEINKRDAKGYTPLKRARLSMQNAAAQLLQDKGARE